MIARLRQDDTRQKIRADIARDGLNNWGRIPSWDCVQISISPHLPQFSGRSVASLAAERGADPIDTLCDYLARDLGATRVLVTSISEADIRTIVVSPHALVGSDGNCVAPYGTVGKGMPHPRFYGTFPRILSRYVRDEKALPLALAVHKMTGATARALKLKDRGLLRQGFCADVVLFDPDDFTDRATYADPHQFPSGARTTVIVNGTLVVENATHTGALPGNVLRRDAAGAVG
jgi:N-acyl-D-aspartate/D-glutamate deacylase